MTRVPFSSIGICLLVCIAQSTSLGQGAAISPARLEARKQLGQLCVQYNRDSFIQAATEGDIIAVQMFLAAGMDPNVRLIDGHTALDGAVSTGHDDVVRDLLAAGATIGSGTLVSAAGYGNASIVRMLLERGAVIDGYTLVRAAEKGSTDTVRMLLDKGAAARATSGQLVEALTNAAKAGNVEIVRMLADKGADVNGTDPQRGRPLVAGASRADVVNTLLGKGTDLSAAGGFALLTAAMGSSQAVQTLLKKGVDANSRNYAGRTPLMEAIERANVGDDVVKILLENGARVDAQENVENNDYQGRTPLIMAAQRGRRDVVELVLRKGASVDSQDANGRTALMDAAEKGYADVVRLLLAAHADPNAADNRGWSALISAAAHRQLGIVKQLLAAHADPNAVSSEGQGYTALSAAAGASDAPPDSVIALLDAGANPNPPGARTSPLLLAASVGNVPIAKALIARGANVNFKDPSGQTPLGQAAVHKKQEITQLLVAAGAKL